MEARIAELGSLVWLLAFLAILGTTIVIRALRRAQYIRRTASCAYVSVSMQVLDFRLAPLAVDGAGLATDPSTNDSSMVMVGYRYRVDGKTYVSDAVFPMKIEWLNPRVAALRLMDDLESGRLHSCHVDVRQPSEALLFTGWTPYLRSHILGVFMSGVSLIALSAVLCWFI